MTYNFIDYATATIMVKSLTTLQKKEGALTKILVCKEHHLVQQSLQNHKHHEASEICQSLDFQSQPIR